MWFTAQMDREINRNYSGNVINSDANPDVAINIYRSSTNSMPEVNLKNLIGNKFADVVITRNGTSSSFCRMAFTLCICLLFSGCAASLSDANAKGKETVTESTSQTDSVDLTQPSDGSSDAAQMKIISSANGNRREDQERQYVQSGFLQIPV